MVRWYTERGRSWPSGRVDWFKGRVGVKPEAVAVQDLGFRWGLCGKGSRLYFHWREYPAAPEHRRIHRGP